MKTFIVRFDTGEEIVAAYPDEEALERYLQENYELGDVWKVEEVSTPTIWELPVIDGDLKWG